MRAPIMSHFGARAYRKCVRRLDGYFAMNCRMRIIAGNLEIFDPIVVD